MRGRCSTARAALPLVLVATFLLAGCATMAPHPLTVPPGASEAPLIDGVTIVTLQSGAEVRVEYPRIGVDSLRGIRVERRFSSSGTGPRYEHRSHYAVPVDSIVKVEERRGSLSKSLLFALVLAGGVIAIATIPWWASD